jgi:hypothetical protein
MATWLEQPRRPSGPIRYSSMRTALALARKAAHRAGKPADPARKASADVTVMKEEGDAPRRPRLEPARRDRILVLPTDAPRRHSFRKGGGAAAPPGCTARSAATACRRRQQAGLFFLTSLWSSKRSRSSIGAVWPATKSTGKPLGSLVGAPLPRPAHPRGEAEPVRRASRGRSRSSRQPLTPG